MRSISLLLLLQLLLSSIYAKETESVPTATFEVQSQLVVLDVMVTDASGKPVDNLTKDDLQVYDNGVLQTLRSFEGPDARPAVLAQPGKDRYGHDDWGESPLTMLVVDVMDTPFGETAYARNRVEKYLKAQPALLAEPTILLWLDDKGLHEVTSFTHDRDTLLQAVQKHPASLPGKFMRHADAEEISQAMAALQQTALFSRGAVGKKEILWVGRSFPALDPSLLTTEEDELVSDSVRSTIDLLLASRVSVYVIDPMSMSNNAEPQHAIEQTTGDAADVSIPAIAPSVAQKHVDLLNQPFDMNLFAEQTGGAYYMGRNDLDREIGESIQRGAAYYTLSYVPQESAPNSYHSIRLVMKNPALHAQTKPGYYAGKPPEDTKELVDQHQNQMVFDLYEAGVSTMDYSGINASVMSCERDKSLQQSTCLLHVDTGSLTYKPQQDGSLAAEYLGMMAALDAKGRMIRYHAQLLKMVVPAEKAKQIQVVIRR